MCFFKKQNMIMFINFREKWAKVEWNWFDCFCLTIQAKSSQVRQFFMKNTSNSSLFIQQKSMFFVICCMISERKYVNRICIFVRDTMIFKGKSILKKLWINVIIEHKKNMTNLVFFCNFSEKLPRKTLKIGDTFLGSKFGRS